MAIIPINGNDGHFSKTESNAVAGYMSVFTPVDCNLAGYGMTAKPKDDSQPPAAHRRQRAHSMSGITPSKMEQPMVEKI